MTHILVIRLIVYLPEIEVYKIDVEEVDSVNDVQVFDKVNHLDNLVVNFVTEN